PLHVGAHRGLGNFEVPRRRREAAAVHDARECSNAFKRVHWLIVPNSGKRVHTIPANRQVGKGLSLDELPEPRKGSTMDANAATTGPFVRQPAAGSTLNVLGVTHIYKATGAETAGSFSLWEDLVPPGTGAPPHSHEREDEAFYVLSGEIQIEFEGEPAPRHVGSGGFFYGARHKRHGYRNVSDQPARLLVLCTPSCGLDQMFAELGAATVSGIPEMAKLAAITA